MQVEQRVKHFKEFEKLFCKEDAKIQGARCMDCGIPFCHGDTGCPVQNYIPEWNDLIYRGCTGKRRLIIFTPQIIFPSLPGDFVLRHAKVLASRNKRGSPCSIKAIERTIIEKDGKRDWVKPRMPYVITGKKLQSSDRVRQVSSSAAISSGGPFCYGIRKKRRSWRTFTLTVSPISNLKNGSY